MTSLEPLPTMNWSAASPRAAAQLLAQRKAAAVRVKLAVLQRVLGRRHRLGRGTERVFIRRQLDDAGGVEPELARDLSIGLPGS